MQANTRPAGGRRVNYHSRDQRLWRLELYARTNRRTRERHERQRRLAE